MPIQYGSFRPAFPIQPAPPISKKSNSSSSSDRHMWTCRCENRPLKDPAHILHSEYKLLYLQADNSERANAKTTTISFLLSLCPKLYLTTNQLNPHFCNLVHCKLWFSGFLILLTISVMYMHFYFLLLPVQYLINHPFLYVFILVSLLFHCIVFFTVLYLS